MASLTEQDGTPLYGLSLIDFFDSNSGVYKKYLNSTEEATYPYAGFGRYKLKQSLYWCCINFIVFILIKTILCTSKKYVKDFNNKRR